MEEVFGWIKTVAGGRKLRFIDVERNRRWAEFTASAYNFLRMAKLGACYRVGRCALQRLGGSIRPVRIASTAPGAHSRPVSAQSPLCNTLLEEEPEYTKCHIRISCRILHR